VVNIEFKKCITPCINQSETCAVCDIDQCLKCTNSTNNNLLFDGVCVESCPPATTQTGINCSCDLSCSKCGWDSSTNYKNVSLLQNQSAQCFLCSNLDYNIYQNMCVAICPNDTILIVENKVCASDCDPTLYYLYSEGTNEKICYRNCPRDLIYYERTCVSQCPDGYFIQTLDNFSSVASNLSEYYCQSCSNGCTTCLNESENTCLDCLPSYVFLSNENTCYLSSICPTNLGYINLTSAGTNCTYCYENCSFCHSTLFTYKDYCLEICPDNCFPVFDNVTQRNICQKMTQIYYLNIENNMILFNEEANVNRTIIFTVSDNIPFIIKSNLQYQWSLKDDFDSQQNSTISSFNFQYSKRNDVLIIPPNTLKVNGTYRVEVTLQISPDVLLNDFLIFSTVNIVQGDMSLILNGQVDPYEQEISIYVKGWHSEADSLKMAVILFSDPLKDINANIDIIYLLNDEIIDEKNEDIILSAPNITNFNFIMIKIYNNLYEYSIYNSIVIKQLNQASTFIFFNLTQKYLSDQLNIYEESETFNYLYNWSTLAKIYSNLTTENEIYYLAKLLNDSFIMASYYNPPQINYHYYILDYIYGIISVGYIKCINLLDCSGQGTCYFSSIGKKNCYCYPYFSGSHCQIDDVGFNNLTQKIQDLTNLSNEIFEVVSIEKTIPFFLTALKNLVLMTSLLNPETLSDIVLQLETIFDLSKYSQMQLSLFLPILANTFAHFQTLETDYFILFSRIKNLILKCVDSYSRNILWNVSFGNSSNVYYSNSYLSLSVFQLVTSNLTSLFSEDPSLQNFFIITNETANILNKNSNFLSFSTIVWKFLPGFFTINNNIISYVVYFNIFDVIMNEWLILDSNDITSTSFILKIPILTSFDSWNNILTSSFNVSLINITNNSSNLWICQYWNNFLEIWQSNGCYLQQFINDSFYCVCSNFTFKEYSVRINLEIYQNYNFTYVYQVIFYIF